MDVPRLEMERYAARRKLESYRQQRCKNTRLAADKEYEAAMVAYEALAQGWPILSLTAAIRHGGLDQHWRPRLAIARADRKRVRFRWNQYSETVYFDTREHDVDSDSLHLKLDMGRLNRSGKSLDSTAIVPMIPADVRERIGRIDDSGRHLLFEAEWDPVPPKDPILLRRLGSTDFFAIEAEWELTPIEQAIIALSRSV